MSLAKESSQENCNVKRRGGRHMFSGNVFLTKSNRFGRKMSQTPTLQLC
jgi:hypothetical protein